MVISARCDYACKALLELSLHWPCKEPLQIHIISKRQNIPMKYLVQILIQLKNAGWASSLRGKEGGYNLNRQPSRIKLGEVIRQIGGSLLPVANSGANNKAIFANIWDEAEDAMEEVLDRITFEDICNKVKGLDKAVNYQI